MKRPALLADLDAVLARDAPTYELLRCPALTELVNEVLAEMTIGLRCRRSAQPAAAELFMEGAIS